MCIFISLLRWLCCSQLAVALIHCSELTSRISCRAWQWQIKAWESEDLQSQNAWGRVCKDKEKWKTGALILPVEIPLFSQISYFRKHVSSFFSLWNVYKSFWKLDRTFVSLVTHECLSPGPWCKHQGKQHSNTQFLWDGRCWMQIATFPPVIKMSWFLS